MTEMEMELAEVVKVWDRLSFVAREYTGHFCEIDLEDALSLLKDEGIEVKFFKIPDPQKLRNTAD